MSPSGKGSPTVTLAEKQTRASSKLSPQLQTAASGITSNASRNPDGTYSETTGGTANTWTNYTNAGGNEGPQIPAFATVEIACVVQGFRVANGNTNWYQIASSPWNYTFYVSADPFYNNGQTSGSLHGTPFVDPSVPACGGGYAETAGGAANTWTNYTNAGGSQGPTIGGGSAINMACRLTGFTVQDGNNWWYRIASPPWSNQYYVSADAFYNNGQTSGSLIGTPFVDTNVPTCSGSPGSPGGTNETAGGAASTWTDYTNAGGTEGQTVAGGQTIVIACKIQGFRVPDGNTYWYRIASAPWNGADYVSADAFYNNGQTSGTLVGTPFYDPAVPDCTSSSSGGTDPSTTPPGGVNETTGGVAHTFTNYTNAGGTQGADIGAGQTVLIACKLTGFRVADGNTWWYQIAASPWSGSYYVSADPFYNNGATTGPLKGTPYVDYDVPDCATQSGGGSSPSSGHPSGETAGGVADTFGNYSHAGAPGPNQVPAGATIQVTCRAQGFRVADGNTWWYLIASAPWNNVWYVSADPFYNNGQTSGLLGGTPFYDPSVPVCQNNSEAPLYGTSYGSAQASTHTPTCGAADPVNCASGNFSHAFTDISIAGRGPGINLARTYNSLSPSSGSLFGNGWSSTYDQSLNTDSPTRAADGSIVIDLADGSEITATPDGTGYSTPQATDSTFVANPDGTYTLTMHQNVLETFSASGQLVATADLNGYRTTLSYDSSGHLTGITDSSGRTVTVAVGSNGLVSGVTDPMGRTTTYTYDGSDNLISTTDPLGRSWNFTYDANNRMLTMTDPRGGVVKNTYQPDGRVSEQVDGAGLTTTFAYTGDNYSSLGGTTTVTDPHGGVRIEQYANGFLAQVTQAYGTPEQGVWSYTYDPNTYGVTSVTDPDGNLASSTYNATGQVLTRTDALGNVTTNTYNGFGEVLTTTTPLGAVTAYSYDANGNRLAATDPLDGATIYTYGDNTHPGDVTSLADPDGRVTTFTYDSDGDVIAKTVSPSAGIADTTTYAYDLDSEQDCQVSPDATATGVTCPAPGGTPSADTTTTIYDARGEPISVTDPNGHTTQATYDSNGNKVAVTDPNGNVTTNSYDSDNRLVSTTAGASSPIASTTAYSFDLTPGSTNCPVLTGATYCTATTNPNGGVTVDVYNARNELIQTTLAGGQTTSYTYDAAGNKTTEADNAGDVTTYGYDLDYRETSIGYSNPDTPNVIYTYDHDSRRTSMSDGTGTTNYTYDADGRLISTIDGAGETVGYSYDNYGNVITLTYPNGQNVTRSYDGADRLVSVSDWLGNTTTFGYDADGNLTSTIYPNGDTVTASFDPTDALTLTGVTGPGGILAGIAYTRDPDGLVSQETDSGALTGTTTYSYNTQNQLTSANTSTYQVDAAGNLTSNGGQSQTFNTAAQLTTSTAGGLTTTYGYDPNGDRTSATFPSGAGTDYSYDQIGQLLSVAQVTTTPTVTNVGPAAGPVGGGTTVTITGSGLTDATAVTFGTSAARSYKVVSDTQITAVTPAQPAGTTDIYVTTPGGTSGQVAGDKFSYQNQPTVTGISPQSGPIGGGTLVTVTGSGFIGATNVTFGAVAATHFTVVSGTQLTAISPAQTAAMHNITVTTPLGTSHYVTGDQFTYQNAPTVTAITPKTGTTAGGTTVTVTGTGFIGATNVTFGAVAATHFTVVSGTQLTAISPAQTAAMHNITVTTPLGTSHYVTGDQFTYQNAPTVTRATATAAARPVRHTVSNLAPDVTAVLASYAYNGDGLRMNETTPAGTSSFVWDITPTVPAVLADSNNFYVYGPDGLPVEQIDTNSNPSYYFHDANGSTRALLSSSGVIGATFTYNSYGAVTSQTGTLDTPLLYGQGYTDTETGLIYLVHRYYDPTTGQFVSVDPALSVSEMAYGYVADDPLNSNDPAGELCLSFHCAISDAKTVAGKVGTVAGYIQTGVDVIGITIAPIPGVDALDVPLAAISEMAGDISLVGTCISNVQSAACGYEIASYYATGGLGTAALPDAGKLLFDLLATVATNTASNENTVSAQSSKAISKISSSSSYAPRHSPSC